MAKLTYPDEPLAWIEATLEYVVQGGGEPLPDASDGVGSTSARKIPRLGVEGTNRQGSEGRKGGENP